MQTNFKDFDATRSLAKSPARREEQLQKTKSKTSSKPGVVAFIANQHRPASIDTTFT